VSHAKEGDVLQQGGVMVIDADGTLRFFAEAPVAAEPVPADRIVDAAMALVAERAASSASATANAIV
jgi:hypothetical protein